MARTSHRIRYRDFRPGLEGMLAIHRGVTASALDPSVRHLVKVRVSQVNGCAYCIDLHTREAAAAGEPDHRLHALPAWRDAPHYTPRERAALALAEAVTVVADTGVADAVLDEAERHYDTDELPALLFAIVEINAWNRLAITSRVPVGIDPATT